MIKVTPTVLRQIEWINSKAFYDPFNFPVIATTLGSCGYTEAADWILNNPQLYIEGVRDGFYSKDTFFGDDLDSDIATLSDDEWYEKYLA